MLINGVIELRFTVDTGASDVVIPSRRSDDALTDRHTERKRLLGFEQTYVLADGSRVASQTFRIRTLKVGRPHHRERCR